MKFVVDCWVRTNITHHQFQTLNNMNIYELYIKRITQVASDSFEIEGIVEDFEGTVDQVYLDGVLWTDAVASLDDRKHTLTITSSCRLTGDERITFTIKNKGLHEDYADVQ